MSERRGFAFDVDGTLTEPGQIMDGQMADSLLRLSKTDCVIGIFSGAPLTSIQRQCEPFFDLARKAETIQKMMLFPTSGARCYRFNRDFWCGWEKIYEYGFGAGEALRILMVLRDVLEETGYHGKLEEFLWIQDKEKEFKNWGQIILDRGSQITFAALGEHSPSEQRKAWDTTGRERRRMVGLINKRIGNIALARIGGGSSIDINILGIDKGFAMLEFLKISQIPFYQMLFVGDGLFPGGNDYPVKERTQVFCHSVEGPNETKTLIRFWLKA